MTEDDSSDETRGWWDLASSSSPETAPDWIADSDADAALNESSRWPPSRVYTTPEENDIDFYVLLYKITVPTLFGLIMFAGLVGNSLVVIVTVTQRKMHTTVNLLLLNLAVSDLIFLVVAVPFMAYHYAAENWLIGDVMCKLSQYVLYVTVYVTVYTLVAISVVRFVYIVHARRSSSKIRRRIGVVIGVVWAVMLAVNCPVLVFYRVKRFPTVAPDGYDDNEPYLYCGLENHQVHGPRLFISFFILAYVLPLMTIATMYVLIFRYLHTKHRRSTLHQLTVSSRRNTTTTDSCRGPPPPVAAVVTEAAAAGYESTAAAVIAALGAAGPSTAVASMRTHAQRRTSYASRVFLAVVFVFGACWLPLHVNLLVAFFGVQPTSRAYEVFRAMCHCFAYSNSCMNPFVYSYVSRDFRRGLRAVVAGIVACRRLRRGASRMAGDNGGGRTPGGGGGGGGGGCGCRTDGFQLNLAVPGGTVGGRYYTGAGSSETAGEGFTAAVGGDSLARPTTFIS